MGSILGDFFKTVGRGVDKVSEGDVLDGLSDILGGTVSSTGRAIGSTLEVVGKATSLVGEIIDELFGDGEITPNEISDENLPLLGFIAHVGMLAKMAKADGRVSPQEIECMEELIASWNLGDEAVENVHNIFRAAKDSDQSIYELAEVFTIANNQDRAARLDMYYNLWAMALSDDLGMNDKLSILQSIPEFLGLENAVYCDVLAKLQMPHVKGDASKSLDCYYEILGCPPDASDAEVRRRYKEKIAQFHPDVISGKNLAPAFIEFANQQAAKLNEAFEAIKAARGMR